MTKESGAKGASRAWKRRTVATTVLGVGCLAPVTLGHIEIVQRPQAPQKSVRLDIPLPPEQTFVFDPGDDRHANFRKAERPQPLEAIDAIEASAPPARVPQAKTPRSMELDPPLVSAYARAVDPAYPTGVVDPAAGL
ncbi:MAG: hypothetical protein KDJ20_19150, partial [Hyphomicrobiales bacterium]|nr:hypothetical protein [Hyphomicrobiales bacterium]